MVKHVILWAIKEEYGEEEKVKIRKEIKEGLEGLKDIIPGIVEIKVNICPLESSNCDLMLDSTFIDEEALKAYAVNPAHVDVAVNKVKPFTSSRVCMDYEV
ncbi:MAG: Dabb family protein [Eubacterium sp.]|nr:Dabb family protein [Eubacterium sp.]